MWVCLYVYLKKKKKLEIESIYNAMFQVYSNVVGLYLCMYLFQAVFHYSLLQDIELVPCGLL